MKKILIIAFFLLSLLPVFSQIPNSEDLIENDDNPGLKRDLSIPHSRIVINYFDFSSTLLPKVYSDNATMPLNIAWLSTNKNIQAKDPITRFSRSIPDLLMLYSADINLNDSLGKHNLGAATFFTTQWLPYKLPFTAKYKNGMEINGFDFFYDNYTVIRSVKIKNANKFYISGRYKGRISVDNNSLFIDNNNIRYAITLNSDFSTPYFKDDCWIMPVDVKKLKDSRLNISVSFIEKHETREILVGRVKKPIEKDDISRKLASRKNYWDNFLKKVPQPRSFNLNSVDSKGVSAQQIKKSYYQSWIFLAQNILPEDKEVFPYPQICTGKASLWDEGDKKAPFSAAWESFIGMQLYAFIDPQLSWRAFKGLMSLIDAEGILGGESLPSRKAQTALLLYRITKDRISLKEVYQSLCRYMEWRLKYPHWVYGDIKPTEYWKDAEFVFSAIVDMKYLSEIAQVLGYSQQSIYWKQKREDFYNQSLNWFWETPDSLPVQEYYTDTHVRKPRNTIWVSISLYIDLLKDTYLKTTLQRFNKDFDPNKNFAGFTEPKYPDISYSVYGLIDREEYKLAEQTMECMLRDIIRADASFAEVYTNDELKPIGVRPSLFGACTIIDFCLLLNGYKYDRGLPEQIFWKDKKEYGVKNIHYGNKVKSFIHR